jgi:3,4-dihydroxy-2-butanone 4-phosphate synthase
VAQGRLSGLGKYIEIEQIMTALNTIDEILEDIRQGKMAVLMDDEDRENEGDLIMAAECVRAEDVNFMARYGRGLICLTLTRDPGACSSNCRRR